MADNQNVYTGDAGSAFGVAADEVTFSGDASQKLQVMRPAHVTGSEGAKTVVDVTQSTGSAVPGAVVFVGGTDGTNARALKVDSTGAAHVIGSMVFVSTDVTRPADTSAYAANDAWSDSTSAPTSGGFTFTSAGRSSGGSGFITDAVFATSNDPATTLQGELFIFNQSVTNINDNAAFVISDTEVKTLIGIVPFTLEDIGNNGYYHAKNLNIGYTCSGSANLRFLVRVKNAYTPASSEVLTCGIKVLRVD